MGNKIHNLRQSSLFEFPCTTDNNSVGNFKRFDKMSADARTVRTENIT